MPVRRSAIVRFTIPGLHYWPEATGVRRYLGQPHRHLFHITVEIDVKHNDRELEFHDLRDVAMAITRRCAMVHPLEGDTVDFGPQSCEAIATFVAMNLRERYGKTRRVVVTVSEDNEVDGRVEFAAGTTRDALGA